MKPLLLLLWLSALAAHAQPTIPPGGSASSPYVLRGSGAPQNNHCAKWEIVSGVRRLTTTGAPCGEGGAGSILWGGITGTLGDQADLAAALAAKAALSHLHAIVDVTGLQTALDGKAALIHAHAISDIANLQTALNGKAATSHTHSSSDITDLQATVRGYLSAVSPILYNSTTGQFTLATVPLNLGGTNNTSWTASRCVQVSADGTRLESSGAACGVAATAWGAITGTLSSQTDLQSALNAKSDTNHVHPEATTGAAGFMSASDKTKLNAIQTGATANQTDAHLLARANHTGTQAIATVDGLQGALDGKEPGITTLAASKGGLNANASAFAGVIRMSAGVASVVPGTATDCVLVNGTSGPCGTGGASSANETFPFTSVTQLDIEHDAASKALVFEIYDSLDRQIQPNSITHLSDNVTRVTFSASQTGYVVVSGGGGSSGGIASVVTGDGLLGDGTIADPVRVNPATVPTFLTGSATLNDWGTIAAQACAQKTFSLAGAVSNDAVIPRWPAALPAGLSGLIFVSAGDTVAVRVCNPTAAGVALPNGNVFGATILRSF